MTLLPDHYRQLDGRQVKERAEHELACRFHGAFLIKYIGLVKEINAAKGDHKG